MFSVMIEGLRDFDQLVKFWGGAREVWDSLTEDEIDILEEYADEITFDSLTSVNDFIWFDAKYLLEAYVNEVG